MDTLKQAFEGLSTESEDLYIPSKIQEIRNVPSSIEFLRNWVCPNVPLVLRQVAKTWPAVQKWDFNYLIEKMKNKKVSVAVTPNGYADAITNYNGEEVFVIPEERVITIGDLFAKLYSVGSVEDTAIRDSKGIFYLQKQDSNLTKEFPELLADLDELSWAQEAFGAAPNASNIWIGDSRSVTSLHKDPFENIYCVVSGWKDFILLPPTDRPWLPYKTLPVMQYKEVVPGEFVIEPTLSTEETMSSEVPWITIDPLSPDYDLYPDYKKAHPLHVRVQAGDLLYLPSLWFHHVRQSDKCIAVNFWYDMEFDIKFVYFQFLEQLVSSYDDDVASKKLTDKSSVVR